MRDNKVNVVKLLINIGFYDTVNVQKTLTCATAATLYITFCIIPLDNVDTTTSALAPS